MNRIISAVMMVLSLIMTTAAASAEAQSRPSISVSADYYSGALNIVADIENDTSEQVVGTMYFSVYDGDRLAAVKTVKNTVADTGMSSIEESIDTVSYTHLLAGDRTHEHKLKLKRGRSPTGRPRIMMYLCF